ncbi:hypothetical protein N9262_02360 [Akkermansiaceae bacterium]|nr:hypothetical protein [Akkermansiaceae bacterium]
MALQPILMPIVSVFKSQGIKNAQGAVAGLSKNFGQLAGTLGKAAGAFAGFQAVSSSRAFVIDSVEATQKFERNMLALQQTFETATPTIQRFVKEVENYGLSQQQAAQASVFLGSVLKQYGFSVSESADQTQRLVTLAQDLATTYGYDVQDSLLAITALFRGEYDPIEKFGVAMKQNEINAYLAAKGLGNLTGAELANAQATARLELLFERAGDSVGAFTRASDTLYGSQQRLNAIMGNLQVAFGAAFQKPLADVNNALANVAQDGGENLVDISGELGSAIESLAPLLESLGGFLISLIGPLEQIIALAGGAAGALGKLLAPLIDIGTGALDQVNIVLDDIALQFKKLDEAQQVKPGQETFLDKMLSPEYNRIGTFIADLDAQMDKLWTKMESRTKLGEALLFDGKQATEARRDSALVGRLASQMDIAAAKAEALAAKVEKFGDNLYGLGIQAVDAEGDLAGLAGIFVEIEEAAQQSNAAEALDKIGFSAGQIEEILTRPDWAAIFGDISTLARIAALDIDLMTVKSVTAAAAMSNARLALQQSLNGITGSGSSGGGGGPAKEEATNYVQDFLDGIQEEVMKQTARLQLQNMTGSEGLIESILGAENWLQLWTKIKAGIIPLQDLEDQFYRTAAGAQELADAAEEWKAYEEAVQAVKDQLAETVKAIQEQAADLKLSFTDLLTAFDVLPTIATEMGRFETAVVSQLASIEKSLQSAFRNDDLFEDGYKSLSKFAQVELQKLQEIGRQRDDMANRYKLSEALISEYETAITGALRLTSIFSSLKDETEKRTVTEVTKGVVKLGQSLREFNIVVTREYEETITKVTDKTAGLLDGFKQMAAKSKDFANNLRTLKDMGLDGQLFNQLVQAGVEAGGETAQALVDGGQETVSEISSVFAEVNALGAELGEEVATTLYGTGIDLVDGLIEGILSEQARLEEAAYAMADAFNTAFQNSLNTEIDKVTSQRVADATQAANDEIAKIPVPEMPKVIDEAALNKINDLIAGANRYIGNVTGNLQAGGQAKLEIYKALAADIASGGMIDVSGIQSGMSSGDLLAVAQGTGSPTVTNNFNLTVSANGRTEGAAAGEAAINAINKFTQNNGSRAVVSLTGN